MRSLLAVFVGGVVGTGLRLGLDLALPPGHAQFPLSTLLINIVGAFTLAFLVARLWPTASAELRAGLGAGLLGSFTTFSALAVALVTITTDGQGMLALSYLAATLVGGLAAAALGLRLGRRGTATAPLDLVDE